MQDGDNVAGIADFGIADAADGHVFATLRDAGLRGWSLVVEGEGLPFGHDEFPLRLADEPHVNIHGFRIVLPSGDANEAEVTLRFQPGLDGVGVGFAAGGGDIERLADAIIIAGLLAPDAEDAAQLRLGVGKCGICIAHRGIQVPLDIEHMGILGHKRSEDGLHGADGTGLQIESGSVLIHFIMDIFCPVVAVLE